MKRSLRFYIFPLLIVSLALAAAVSAQKPTPTPDETTKVFEVRLPVTVTTDNKKKDLVPGLTKGDFIVLEDGIPQDVTFFSDEKSNPTVYVGVLMYTSPSTNGTTRIPKEAA